jgi:hypothetical protein
MTTISQRLPIAALVLAAALMVPAAAPAASHKTACQKLHGRDLAVDGNFKLVKKGNSLYSCKLKKGKVRKFATGQPNVIYTNRGFALVSNVFGDQYNTSYRTALINMGTGRTYGVISKDCMMGDPCLGNSATKGWVTITGQSVVSIEAGGTTQIVGFSATGTRVLLDEGPSTDVIASSLTFAGNTASWTTTGGVPKTVALP